MNKEKVLILGDTLHLLKLSLTSTKKAFEEFRKTLDNIKETKKKYNSSGKQKNRGVWWR